MSDIAGYYDTSYPPSLWLGPDPSITSLNPNTGSAAAGPIAVTVTGTDFDASSVVEINQQAQPTTYVNATTLTVNYDPPTAGAVLFTVRRGNQESNSVPFNVTAAAEEPNSETEPTTDYVAMPVADDEVPEDGPT